MKEPPRGNRSAGFDIGGEGDTEQDVLFEVLSHSYRRFVLQYLDEADGPQTVNEVATELGAWQADLPVGDRSVTGINAIELALHHHHLPKMAAAGVIEYDPTRGMVTPDTRATELTSYLDESTAPVGHDRTT